MESILGSLLERLGGGAVFGWVFRVGQFLDPSLSRIEVFKWHFWTPPPPPEERRELKQDNIIKRVTEMDIMLYYAVCKTILSWYNKMFAFKFNNYILGFK